MGYSHEERSPSRGRGQHKTSLNAKGRFSSSVLDKPGRRNRPSVLGTFVLTAACFLVVVVACLSLAGCSLFGSPGSSNTTDAPVQRTLASGLVITDTQLGTGPEAKAGDTVTVRYLGYLDSFMVFDSSYDHDGTFQFTLGSKIVIEGWEEGIPGMAVGGKRQIVIPPNMAYGSTGAGKIPPNATLTFDVELVSIN